MPTYEYRCKECDHGFEIVQSFSDDALTKCPECKKKAIKKVYGNVGISFKGSGFYKNDARSSSGGGSKSSSGSSDASSSSSTSSPEKKSGDSTSAKKESTSSSGSSSSSGSTKSSD